MKMPTIGSWIQGLLAKRPQQVHRNRRLRMARMERVGSIEELESRWLLSTASFAVIGDYGTDTTPENDVANLVKSWNPEFIITVGDNNYDTGSAATIDAHIGKYYHDYIGNYTGTYGAGSTPNRFFPSLGNHDWQTRSGTPALPTPYLNYFTLPGNERYFTFTQGPVQFFAIDSGDGTGSGADGFEPDKFTCTVQADGNCNSTEIQGRWLHDQLAASTAPWKLVYFHHAPYSSGSHGNSTVMQWPFQAWGASAVLTGHDHDYERVTVGGLPYFVNGVGGRNLTTFGSPIAGSQVRYSSDYGAMRVDATDTSVQFQFITRTGTVIDTYTLSTTALPTVTISATDASAAEPGTDTGTFTVTRTGGTSAALTVSYTVGGTATSGSDYAALSGSVTIPVGSASATIPVTPSDDVVTEATETVIATLSSSVLYNTGSPGSATVSITDNDSSTVTLVPTGAVWKYLDNGTNQGTAWRASAFVDSTWASGAAELGYGDGGEATVVSYGPNASAKYITTYFRRAFTVDNAAAVTALNLRLLRDDGAVVYLNGTEVFRNNLPTGTISYTTLASVALGGVDETTFLATTVSPSLLVTGSNVFAVEIHQANGTSTDISFNLDLVATVDTVAPAAPSTPDLAPASDTGLDNDDDLTNDTTPTFTGTAEAGSTVRIFRNGVQMGSGVATGGSYTITTSTLNAGTHSITATATDAAGNVSPASAALSISLDTSVPTADISDVTPDPRATSISQVTITFSELVSGFDLADLQLTRDGSANLLTASQTLTSSDNITWTLGNLSSLTGTAGTYTITLTAAGSGITDPAGNALAANAADSFVVDTTAPTADILDVTPDPRSTAVSQITLTFSEVVSGVNLADLQLTRSGGSNLLTASQTLTTSDNITWTLGNLSSLTGTAGTYTITLTAAGSGIVDTAGNSLVGNASDVWQMTVPPPVTIIDDGAAGFTKVGTSWKTATGQGYLSDITTSTAGTGSSVATWTFSGLSAGQYRVSATWTAQTKRATNSPFTVLDGNTALATVLVSQKAAPNDFSDSGAVWENLGGPYQINGTTLVVRLTNQANGVVVADAVRIELVTSSAPAAASAVGDGAIANTSHSPTIGSTAEQPTQPSSVSPPVIFSASLLATLTSGRATLDPPRSTSAPVAELSRSANPRQQTTTGARLQPEAVDAFFGLVGAGVLEAFDTTGSP